MSQLCSHASHALSVPWPPMSSGGGQAHSISMLRESGWRSLLATFSLIGRYLLRILLLIATITRSALFGMPCNISLLGCVHIAFPAQPFGVVWTFGVTCCRRALYMCVSKAPLTPMVTGVICVGKKL